MKRILLFISGIVFLIVFNTFGQNHFTVNPSSGCGSLTTSFTNLHPSQGYSPVFMLTTGYKYQWNFGNGQTSTLENPSPVVYNSPGVYDISYNLTIDTVGFFLTKIDVTSVGCNDPFGGAPDVYIIIRDASYNVVYSTESSIYNNQWPPYEWSMNLKLNNPPYFLWVWDDDPIDANDNCVDDTENTPGVSTQIILPSNNASGFGTTIYEGTNGSLQYKFTFYKPVITYSETQQVEVFEKPNAPILSNTNINLCYGESVPEIVAVGNSGNTIKWYSDNGLQNLVHTGTNYTPTIIQEGTYNYYVTQTNSNNCSSNSTNVTINISKLPSPTLNPYNEIYCVGQNVPTFSAIGSNIKWYYDQNLQNWICDGNSLNIEHNETGNYTYYAVQTNQSGTCVSDPVVLQFSIIDAISAEIVTNNVSCFGLSDGSAQIVNLAGNSPFSFLWSNGSQTQNASGFAAGEHGVTIRDANFCVKVIDFVITQPEELKAETEPVNGFCPYDDYIRINSTVSGGTLPYSYMWSNGSTESSLQNVPHGTYSLTVSDAHNCRVVLNAELSKPDNFNIVSSITKSSCPLLNDGAMEVTVSGGTQPYEFSWSSGSNTEKAENLEAGTYTLTITDFYGCEHTKNFDITNIYSVCLVPATVFTPNGDGKNDTWQIKFIELHPQAKVRVFSKTGQIVFDASGYSSDWDGKYNGKNLPTGSYMYIIDLNDGSEPMRGFVDIIR